jgi:hypothetical protein
MIRRFLLICALIAVAAAPAFTYLFGFTDRQRDHWTTTPITWRLNPDRSANMHGTRSVADVMQASFNTWAAAPNAAVSFTRGADTNSRETGNDGVNLICFVCSGDFSEEEDTLAVTFTTVISEGSETGRILDSDILFNPNKDYSTEGALGNEDLQTVATHEIGHLLGLSHSGVVRAVMFPFAPDNERTLSYDDVAAISTVYAGVRTVPTASINGTVRRNNEAIFGAHVFAESQTAADPLAQFNIRKSPISTLTITDGTFSIQGVPLDTYVITAEPLDLPVENDNINGFAGAFGRNDIQTNFTSRWF